MIERKLPGTIVEFYTLNKISFALTKKNQYSAKVKIQ